MNEKLLYVKEKVEELKHLVRDLGVKLDILTDPRITPLTPRGGSLLVNSMPHGHAPSHLVWYSGSLAALGHSRKQLEAVC